MDATQRILELATQGLSNAKIAAKLNSEGYVNKNKEPYTGQGVWTIRDRIGKKASASVAVKESVDISDKSGISDAMREEIRQVVLEEIKTAMETQTLPKSQIELPPLPGKVTGPKGKPIGEGGRVKIAGTTDEALARRLEEWRTERGLTLSRALDTALWHFLGKPPLSFEISKKPDEPEQ